MDDGNFFTPYPSQPRFQFLQCVHIFRRIHGVALFQKFCVNTPSLSQKILRSTIIHHDNARPHTSLETHTALDRLGLRTLPHPPYSPDLAPSDFFLFPKLKDYLKGNRYETDEDVKNAVLSWCRDKAADFFADGIQQVVRRWRLCIERDGDYVEKRYVIWC